MNFLQSTIDLKVLHIHPIHVVDFDKESCIDCESIMQEITVPINNIKEYINRVVVELFVVGQNAQHKEQAALPKQQATEDAIAGIASKAPIFILYCNQI